MGQVQYPMTLDRSVGAAERAIGRFTDLLRSGVDPAGQATADWTVRDVAAHLAGFLPMYQSMIEGAPSPVESLERLGDFNAGFLASPERDITRFADSIDRSTAVLLSAARRSGPDTVIDFHAGIRLPLPSLLGLLAGEGYVHGYDIARASGRRWVVPPEDATTVFYAVIPVFPYLLDEDKARGFRATVEIRLRGIEDGRWRFDFDGESVAVDRADGHRPDWIMSVAPAAYLLAAYNRLSPLRAALTGQIAAWGRHPAAGMRFAKVFRTF